MSIENDIKNNKTLLVSVKSTVYRDKIKKILNISSGIFRKICYVTINDPHKTLASNMPKVKSEIFWVDCVSSTVKVPKPEKNVIYVSSPHALTEISITIKNVIKKEKTDLVLFDSISAQLVYENVSVILRFIHNLILSLRDANLNALFIILKEDATEELMKDLAMFVDKIVELR